MREWRHNDGKHQWDLGYMDPTRDEFVVVGWVTDEFIDRVYDKTLGAMHIKRKMGSCPPPLAGYLPPEPPVVFEVPAPPSVPPELAWRDIAALYPEFVQWAAQKHGPLEETLDEETYNQLKEEYERTTT